MEPKNRIIETAGNLFITDGIRRITMDVIAKKMGVSKRTIYELFRDKTELLRATLYSLTAKNEAEIAEIKERSSNSMELIVGILQFGIKAINVVNPAFHEDLEMYYPELSQEFMYKSRQDTYEDFCNLVNNGIQEGFFRNDLNVRLVAKVFIEQMNMMNKRDLFPPDEYPATELFETLFLNFIRGISTYEGIQKLDELLESKINN